MSFNGLFIVVFLKSVFVFVINKRRFCLLFVCRYIVVFQGEVARQVVLVQVLEGCRLRVFIYFCQSWVLLIIFNESLLRLFLLLVMIFIIQKYMVFYERQFTIYKFEKDFIRVLIIIFITEINGLFELKRYLYILRN